MSSFLLDLPFDPAVVALFETDAAAALVALLPGYRIRKPADPDCPFVSQGSASGINILSPYVDVPYINDNNRTLTSHRLTRNT